MDIPGIIERACQKHNVSPQNMIGVLVAHLLQAHFAHAGFAFGDKAKPNVLSELAGLSKSQQMPASLIEAMRMAMDSHGRMLNHNAENHRKRGSPSPHLEYQLHCAMAWQEIIRECTNIVERDGIESRLKTEELLEDRDQGMGEA